MRYGDDPGQTRLGPALGQSKILLSGIWANLIGPRTDTADTVKQQLETYCGATLSVSRALHSFHWSLSIQLQPSGLKFSNLVLVAYRNYKICCLVSHGSLDADQVNRVI